ncbi:hypothetical protein P3339_09630 [Microbulbifer sp. MLAF003]|uniref:hypothetical protein n=1 Tax=unclassified Microbulbifer TaxID=2619833 RepID=UPI0024AE4DD2|nr:hypothetical protein [Microbulbifer sp. MLAF003]WHI53001.1 hypothetical protein P3339_09630 [Microbulbifer sp. MLAF003]
MRRKEFKSIAKGFAKRLASRNNDYEGYWSLGQLLTIARQMEADKLSLRASQDVVECNNSNLLPFAQAYLAYLSEMVKRMGGKTSWLQSVSIEFTFSTDPKRSYSFWGQHLMQCSISAKLTSDLGKQFTASAISYCVSHNPNKEQRRAHF